MQWAHRVTAAPLVVLLVAAPEAPSRLSPPAAVSCPRDRLTSYTGRVVSYRRTADALELTIETDWDTTESVRLAPLGLEHLLVRGAPFAATDWARIESSPDRARPALRATAWVCDDRRPPVIDWQPAPAMTNAG
jgi:hypothetical protein